MDVLVRVGVWSRVESGRLACAVRAHWRRILIGAFAGWLVAVVVGAASLAALEVYGLVSRQTSDEFGIVVVLYGVGLGALNAYAFRPAARRAQARE